MKITLSLLALLCTAAVQSAPFTYQGRLNSDGVPANGVYDLTFSLYPAPSGGSPVDLTVTNAAVAITNGIFAVGLDFGDMFDGTPYWLQIAVATNGSGGFTTLSPRQQILAVPYALHATSASTLTGTLPDGQIPSTVPRLNSGSNAFTGQLSAQLFRGDGSGLSNVVAAPNPNAALKSNNGSDFSDMQAARNNLGIMDINARSGISGAPEFAWTNATPTREGQVGIVRNGATTALYSSTGTGKGQWRGNMMINGPVQIGSQYWMGNVTGNDVALHVWANGNPAMIGTNGPAKGAEQAMLIEQPDPRQGTYICFNSPSGWNGATQQPIMGNPVDFAIGLGGYLYGTNTLGGIAIDRDALVAFNRPVDLHFTTTVNMGQYGCRSFLSYDNTLSIWHFPVDRLGNGAYGNEGYQDVLTIDTRNKTILSTNAVVTFGGPLKLGTTNAPAVSAALEIDSTSKGLLLPRMTKAQRNAIASPVAGLAIYQTDNIPGLRVYNGTGWVKYSETID